MLRACAICKKEFFARSSNQKYCSEKCRKVARNESAKKPIKNRVKKSGFLSIEEVLKIGRENGIYGYSNILKFIEENEK